MTHTFDRYDPYAERDGPRVLDIPTAWYLILVTMATVGYGDFSPQTAGGRILMGRVTTSPRHRPLGDEGLNPSHNTHSIGS